MKTKDEIVKALEGLEGGAEFVASLNDLLKDSAKNERSVKELTKKVETLETTNKTLSDSYGKLQDYLGIPVDVKDLDATLDELKKNNGQGNTDMATLKSQLNELTRSMKSANEKNAELEKTAALEKTKRHAMIRDMELRNALEKNKALNPAITAGLMKDKVKVLDDDSVVFSADDGSEVTVDEGVKSFLDKYPEYLANRQLPGAGGGSGGSGGQNINFDTLDPAAYRKLRAEGKIV